MSEHKQKHFGERKG